MLATIREAAANIRRFHERQKRESWIATEENGTILGQKVTPLDSVGVYVPGGTAAYPSSILMNVIPAQVAGVKNITMVSPPSKQGTLSAGVLVTANELGVDTIYKVGGAQAIAALAYGTETITPVDKIVGPGNIYVALAKREVFGDVAIDMIAGPSEIVVLADEAANPKYVAADLLSQAEHDTLASAVVVTPSQTLAEAVAREVEIQLANLPRKRNSVCINRKLRSDLCNKGYGRGSISSERISAGTSRSVNGRSDAAIRKHSSRWSDLFRAI